MFKSREDWEKAIEKGNKAEHIAKEYIKEVLVPELEREHGRLEKEEDIIITSHEHIKRLKDESAMYFPMYYHETIIEVPGLMNIYYPDFVFTSGEKVFIFEVKSSNFNYRGSYTPNQVAFLKKLVFIKMLPSEKYKNQVVP